MCMEHKDFHNTQLHWATLRRRGKVIATARNTIGTRDRGCGWSDYTLHAERAVVKLLGDLSQLHVQHRINRQGDYLNSKPCADCEKFLKKCMKSWGLLKVLYSTEESKQGTSECSNYVR
jgi:hypothetical protein